MKKLLYIFLFPLLFITCKSDGTKGYDSTDLLSHGMPIKIKAPAGAEIKSSDLGIMKDVSVKSGDHFYVQIFSSEATVLDAKQIADRLKEELKQETYFDGIVLEENHGFIFKKKFGDRENYDFRYVKVQGDSEFTYQTGMIGNFSEEDVKSMYAAIK